MQIEMVEAPEVRRHAKVTLSALNDLDDHLSGLVDRLKATVYKPNTTKRAPDFNAAQLAALCEKNPSTMLRWLEHAEEMGLANGSVFEERGKKGNSRRRFTLEEAIAWIRTMPDLRYRRRDGQPGAVITVGFFKGGVGKTTIATSIAQGLSLRGYKVLALDMDPQGSMTAMLGKNPATVDVEETITPITQVPSSDGYRASLAPSIRPSYWSGIDLIAGSTGLFASEFYLPMRAMNAREGGEHFNFLEVLAKGLTPGIRDEYDYIVIDTPPQMSYVTMNAYWASDAILMPVVPEGLSLQSSVQFWNMFTELAEVGQRASGTPKEYSWLGIVPSMVESHKLANQEMMKWLRLAYGEYMLASSIPRTDTVKTGGTEFASVYDISKYVGSSRTYERARTAFDGLVAEVDSMTRTMFWNEKSGEGA